MPPKPSLGFLLSKNEEGSQNLAEETDKTTLPFSSKAFYLLRVKMRKVGE